MTEMDAKYKKELRNFGVLMGVVLGLIGGLLWWREKSRVAVIILLVLSGVFLLAAVLPPLPVRFLPLPSVARTTRVPIQR